MKSISRIQYFLFAIILIGMFSSFAQNEYSSKLISYPYLFIGLLFFIQSLLSFKEFREEKKLAYYSSLECFALGLFFCGNFFISMYWTIGAPIILFGSLIILVLYIGFGMNTFIKGISQRKEKTLFLFSLAFVTVLALVAYTFKFQHWEYAGTLTVLSAIISIFFLMFIIFNINIFYKNEKIKLRDGLRKVRTMLVLSYVFFSFWSIYYSLVSCGIAPKLYSLENPPAMEKLYQEQNPVADIYRKNYQQFLDNRKAASNIQDHNLNSNK